MTSEDFRKAIHIATGGLAFGLRFLPAWAAVALAAGLVLHNLLALPRYAPAILRSGGRRPDLGIVTYPAGVLAIILLFRARLEWAAAAWAVLAFGDGVAGVVGRRCPRPALPWNPDKSWGGSAAFVLAGSLGGGAALWFVAGGGPRPVDLRTALAWATVAAGLAAWAESLPLRRDDNVRVLAAAAVGLGLSARAWSEPADSLAARGLGALGASAVFGSAALALRTVDVAGLVVGVLLVTALGVGGGLGSYACFVTFFVLANAATRWRRRVKEQRGLAQPREGRRGAAHAVANVGVAASLSLAALAGGGAPFLLASSAALATAAFDTVASEVGKASARRARLLTTLREVPAGTPGAVSAPGTLAGLLAASAVAAVGGAAGLHSGGSVWVITLGAALASTLESVAGAVRAVRTVLNGHARNLLNTAAGAGAAAALARWAGS